MRAASISVATGWKEGNKMSYHLLFSERARDKPSAGMLTLKHIWKSTADRELCQHHHCHGRTLTPPSRTRIWCWKHHRNWMSKKEVLCNTTHLCIISTHRHTHTHGKGGSKWRSFVLHQCYTRYQTHTQHSLFSDSRLYLAKACTTQLMIRLILIFILYSYHVTLLLYLCITCTVHTCILYIVRYEKRTRNIKYSIIVHLYGMNMTDAMLKWLQTSNIRSDSCRG